MTGLVLALCDAWRSSPPPAAADAETCFAGTGDKGLHRAARSGTEKDVVPGVDVHVDGSGWSTKSAHE